MTRLLMLLTAVAFAASAAAQTYPAKPVRLLVGYAAWEPAGRAIEVQPRDCRIAWAAPRCASDVLELFRRSSDIGVTGLLEGADLLRGVRRALVLLRNLSIGMRDRVVDDPNHVGDTLAISAKYDVPPVEPDLVRVSHLREVDPLLEEPDP